MISISRDSNPLGTLSCHLPLISTPHQHKVDHITDLLLLFLQECNEAQEQEKKNRNRNKKAEYSFLVIVRYWALLAY
jgi:hypothetical protein